MILEIILGVSAFAFVLLVIFLILTLRDVRKTLKKSEVVLKETHKALDEIAASLIPLLHGINKLVLDLKKKSEGLDIFFHPLYEARKEKSHEGESGAIFSSILEGVWGALRLFQKIKKKE